MINSPSREAALEEIKSMRGFYPFRIFGLVETVGGHFGWIMGKTMAKLNTEARKGNKVWRVV